MEGTPPRHGAHLRQGADGPAHGLVGHADEAHGHLLHRHRLLAGRAGAHLGGQALQRPQRGLAAQRLVLARPEDAGEELGQQAAQAQVGVGDGRRPPCVRGWDGDGDREGGPTVWPPLPRVPRSPFR